MVKKRTFILIPIVILFGMISLYFLFPEVLFEIVLHAERSAGGIDQHSTDVNGYTFEYLEGGKDEALVLLHGFGANKDNWTRIAKHLTPHFRVIAPDLPGFGESTVAPDDDYSIKVQVIRLKAFVRSLGLTSFHLGGSSMGGNIAGAYASSYPSDLKSLLLISPYGVVSSEPSEMARRMADGKSNPLIARSVEEYKALLDFVFAKKPFIPRPIMKLLIKEAIDHQPLNSKIFKQLTDPANILPLEDILKGMTVNTLIIWGDQDRVLHVSGARILDSVMPNARVEIMKAVGHLPMIEKPEKTAELYLNFIRFRRI